MSGQVVDLFSTPSGLRFCVVRIPRFHLALLIFDPVRGLYDERTSYIGEPVLKVLTD